MKYVFQNQQDHTKLNKMNLKKINIYIKCMKNKISSKLCKIFRIGKINKDLIVVSYEKTCQYYNFFSFFFSN